MRNKAISGIDTSARPPTESDTLRRVSDAIRSSLPPAWQLKLRPERRTRSQTTGADAFLEIVGADGTSGTIALEVERNIEPSDVPRLLEQVKGSSDADSFLMAAPFIGRRARELLMDAGIGYWDATGNLRVQLDRPAIYLLLQGAETNPWREPRPLYSLKGPTAGRVVRALCDLRPPYGVLELAERSQTPAASVSRVVQLLER